MAKKRDGLTAAMLVKATKAVRIPLYGAQNVRIVGMKKLKLKTKAYGLIPQFQFKTKDPESATQPSRTHYVDICLRDVDATTPEKKWPKIFTPNTNLVAWCSCLIGSTKVLTKDGWFTMRQLARPIEDLGPPITYMINGKPVEGTAPYHTGKKAVWKLGLSSGRSITGTADHKVLVYGGVHRKNSGNAKRKNRWVRIDKLTVGDKLVLNSFEQTEAVPRSREFYEAFFIGCIMGDGTVSKKGLPDIGKFREDKTLAQREAFKLAGVVRGEDDRRFILNHRARELVEQYQMVNKKSVRLLNHVQLCGYLSGLICTDGSVGRDQVQICGGQPYLNQLQEYLMQYGYSGTSNYLVRKKDVSTNLYTATKDMHMLNLNARTLRSLEKVEGLHMRDEHRVKLDALVTKPAQDRDAWVKITAITYAAHQHVYDISVPGAKRFNAEGVIVHNCEWFCFYSEYALTKYNASSIRYCNGKPPNTTNPGLVPCCCKHIYRVLMQAQQRGL